VTTQHPLPANVGTSFSVRGGSSIGIVLLLTKSYGVYLDGCVQANPLFKMANPAARETMKPCWHRNASTAGHLGNLLALDEDSDHTLCPNKHPFGESLFAPNTKKSISVRTTHSNLIKSCDSIQSEGEREKMIIQNLSKTV
jgi:hypothetical protein